MGVAFFKEPELQNPVLIACWPGIGNIGIIAVNLLRRALGAEEFAEIEPWHFFFPRKVFIRGGFLEALDFPRSKFYFKHLPQGDLIIFTGDQQPGTETMYASGERAYRMANLVLDVAERFGCRRVYTSGACVTFSHHLQKPRVCAVVTHPHLKEEVRKLPNSAFISEIEGGMREGMIVGLNGLLLAVAKKRGFEGICLMGEIPDWLSQAPFPYPKASRSVFEAFAYILNLELKPEGLDEMESHIERLIEDLYRRLPRDFREKYERRLRTRAKREAITEEDVKWIREHIDELFGKKGGEEKHG